MSVFLLTLWQLVFLLEVYVVIIVPPPPPLSLYELKTPQNRAPLRGLGLVAQVKATPRDLPLVNPFFDSFNTCGNLYFLEVYI